MYGKRSCGTFKHFSHRWICVIRKTNCDDCAIHDESYMRVKIILHYGTIVRKSDQYNFTFSHVLRVYYTIFVHTFSCVKFDLHRQCGNNLHRNMKECRCREKWAETGHVFAFWFTFKISKLKSLQKRLDIFGLPKVQKFRCIARTCIQR